MDKVKASIDIGDNITKLIQQLAVQIGTTADKVFPWYVKQQIVFAYTSLAVFTIGLVILGVIFWKNYLKADFEYVDRNAVFAIISGALFLSALIFLVISFSTLLSQIINPEYYAMRELAGHLAELR
ncbi:MAG: hypothetical protein PHO03_01865 [Candidatus Omnitrophica bacterium]|jgi:FlaA1/EpsC-like NDP-sugar epimerase|nr:hypothetical protein [Candidatus Omnitrophota bacterium]